MLRAEGREEFRASSLRLKAKIPPDILVIVFGERYEPKTPSQHDHLKSQRPRHRPLIPELELAQSKESTWPPVMVSYLGTTRAW